MYMKTIFTITFTDKNMVNTHTADFYDKQEAINFLRYKTYQGYTAVLNEKTPEQEKTLQEILQNYKSEDVIFAVQERNDIYFENWYTSEDILSETELPIKYHKHFIETTKDGGYESLYDAVDSFVSFMNDEIHEKIVNPWLESQGEQGAKLKDVFMVVYRGDLGFHVLMKGGPKSSLEDFMQDTAQMLIDSYFS